MQRVTQTFEQVILLESEWKDRCAAHEDRVEKWLKPHTDRVSRQQKHPVLDFLFTYYSFKPSQLRNWTPGIGVTLAGRDAERFLKNRFFIMTPEGSRLNPDAISANRLQGFAWIHNLLALTATRAPFFGCFGFHEWAMLYRAKPGEIRHDVSLRLSLSELSQVVEANSLCCSHFDAFRHFTNAAMPRNERQLSREASSRHEQRGCLHANMDLYKWAAKLAPFISSSLVMDCFELAVEIREVDMRASPYDLSQFGYPAIRIETADGRAEYLSYQKAFAEKSQPLRKLLLSRCKEIIHARNAPHVDSGAANPWADKCAAHLSKDHLT